MSISISYHSMISNSSFATSYLLCKIFKNCLNWFNFMCRSVLLKLLKTREAPLSTLVTLSFPQISWILSANHSGSKSSAVSSLTSIVWYYILEPIILHADLFAEVGEGIKEEKLGTTFFCPPMFTRNYLKILTAWTCISYKLFTFKIWIPNNYNTSSFTGKTHIFSKSWIYHKRFKVLKNS